MYWLSPQVTSFLRKRHFFTVSFIPRALWTVSAQVEIWLSRETNDGFLVWAHCFFQNEPKVLCKIADTVSIRYILSGPHIGWARKFAGVFPHAVIEKPEWGFWQTRCLDTCLVPSSQVLWKSLSPEQLLQQQQRAIPKIRVGGARKTEINKMSN